MLKTIKINNSRFVTLSTTEVHAYPGKGEYFITFNGVCHRVYGGSKKGGKSNEWFVCGLGEKDIPVSGPVEAFKLIANA